MTIFAAVNFHMQLITNTPSLHTYIHTTRRYAAVSLARRLYTSSHRAVCFQRAAATVIESNKAREARRRNPCPRSAFSSCAGPLGAPVEVKAGMSKPSSKEIAVPRPSASVILISPKNQILLLHRVKTSTSFASAYVFPGGNISDFHDGHIPGPDEPGRHDDGESYRLAAIRETFEESGILLAKNNGFGRLIEVAEEARKTGRKQIHGNKIEFTKWLAGHGGRADVDGLIPFTRWITPTNVPKRFTTQMYVYFLPLSGSSDPYRSEPGSEVGQNADTLIPVPTHDGGLEHTAARFSPAEEWISQAQAGKIILFPPQFFLLSMVGQFLKPIEEATLAQLKQQRQELRQFLKSGHKTGEPTWADVCISPTQLTYSKSDRRAVLGLDKPGPELSGTDRRGIYDYVVLTEFKKEGPTRVEIRKREDVLQEQREKGKL